MVILPEHEFLFKQSGAARWLKRNRDPRPTALFPLTLEAGQTGPSDTSFKEKWLTSLDPRALRAKEWMADKLTGMFPTDVLPSGYAGATAVPGDFYKLRNASGYGQDPLPIPVMDNAGLIKKNGLVPSIRPEDGPWLKELVRLFFGHAVPTDLHIRKKASSGFPFFTTDNQYKKMAVLQALRHPDGFLKAMTGGTSELKEGLNKYHALLLYAIQERQQPDSITLKDGKWSSKNRIAPTEQEARDGSFDGESVADKTVRDENGNVIEGHFAMRRRDVFGGNVVVNYFLTGVIGCFREVYLNRFAFTYKTRGRQDKEDRIQPFKYVVGCDVKTMDKMIPKWFLGEVLNLLGDYLDERVIELMRRAYQSPYVVPPPWRDTPDSYNPVFGESPLNPSSFTLHPGLPSGIAFNPDWGKLWMTFVYVILCKDIGALMSPADLEAFLLGKNPMIGLQDTSDDAAFLTNSETFARRLKDPKSPYAVLEAETPVIYLGDVYCNVENKVRVFPNPITYAVNMMCREDSAHHTPIPTWGDSVIARTAIYSATPIFRDMNAILEEACRTFIGVNPMLLARMAARQQHYKEADAIVRANPGAIHYKVDPKDVSPEVLDEIVATIPAADFFDHIKHLFLKRTIIKDQHDI